MTEWISKQIIGFLKRKNAIIQDEEVCLYGCDTIVYTLLSTGGLLLVSWLCNQLSEGCILIFTFYLNQSVGGGYHASTHGKCFLTMVAGLLVGLWLSSFKWSIAILVGIGTVTFVTLLSIPLVLHPHLCYLNKHRKQLTLRSRIFSIAGLAIDSFCLMFVSEKAAKIITIALLLSGISRIIGFCLYKKYAQND